MKTKFILTIILIAGLLMFTSIIGVLLVKFFAWDVTGGSDGILSLLAFVVTAFIFGYLLNRVINRI